MAWTYSGNPATSRRDEVRFLIGDTDPQDPLLQDEEIDYLLAQKEAVNQVAVTACKYILAKLAREVDYTIGPERVAASQKYRHYMSVLQRLTDEASKWSAAPSIAPNHSTPSLPVFDLGMHDYGPRREPL